MSSEKYSRILIVDDNKAELEALTHILRQGYTIYSAKSGEEALRRAHDNMPDLILLDIVMPDMSGFDVLKELKGSHATKDIPVIFITGLEAPEDEAKAFSLGAVDYINKPFHSSIVKARVQSHLRTANQLRTFDNSGVMVKTRQEVRNIPFRELLYVEKSGHWLDFNLIDGSKVSVYATLREYDGILLADPRFAHCHKSFIVNMDFVTSVEVRNVMLKNEIYLPISKRFLGFKKKYMEWISG